MHWFEHIKNVIRTTWDLYVHINDVAAHMIYHYPPFAWVPYPVVLLLVGFVLVPLSPLLLPVCMVWAINGEQ